MQRTRVERFGSPATLVIATAWLALAVLLVVLAFVAFARGQLVGVPLIVFGVIFAIPGALRVYAFVVMRRARAAPTE